jgi:hypothetical protein
VPGEALQRKVSGGFCHSEPFVRQSFPAPERIKK